MDLLVWTILGGLLAAGGGYFIARITGTGRKTRDLQTQLEAKQAELDDYRREVFEQFGETARKFKTLNDSYVDLHRHLARSASLLCGDLGADTLLEAPLIAALVNEVEIVDEVEIADKVEIASGDAIDDKVAIIDEVVIDDGESSPAAEVTVEQQATNAPPSEIPTLDGSQVLEAENEVDNSHWVSAMEEVLDKLKQTPRETIGQDDPIDRDAEPLRNAS